MQQPELIYTRKVNFSKTGQYGCGPKGEDDVYTLEEFTEYCESGMFIDDDGYGLLVKDGKACMTYTVRPSLVVRCGSATYMDATHVVWYNR